MPLFLSERSLSFFVFIVSAISSLLLLVTITVSEAAASGRDGDVIPGSYIVVLNDEAAADTGDTILNLENKFDFESEEVFDTIVQGFSANLNKEEVASLRDMAVVDSVVPNREVSVAATALKSGESRPLAGIRRLGAATDTSVAQYASPVAVIDTGVDLKHPDLNAAHGKSCIGSGPANDLYGHGTHVAGTIGAKNNGQGITGVAPGTPIYSVRVLDENGSGSTATVICGLDWVAENASRLGIRVANMSLGGAGQALAGQTCANTTDPQRQAICRVTNSGVLVVAAAGNNGWDFDCGSCGPNGKPDVPANYPEVLTVTSMVDTNGNGGGSAGGVSCGTGAESDERASSFSNWAKTAAAKAHTIAAPGSCIRSTVPGRDYAVYSGTSMATPHVAALAALCHSEAGDAGPCSGKSPSETMNHLLNQARAKTEASPSYGFSDDATSGNSKYYGFLAHLPLNQSLVPQRPIPNLGSTPDEPVGGVDAPSTDIILTIVNKKKKKMTAFIDGFDMETDVKFECKVNNKAWKSCKKTTTVKNLRKGKNILQVRAVNEYGVKDPTPAKRVVRL